MVNTKGNMSFVVGFLFSDHKDRVALLRKSKPDWMVGKLNGIGGKIEDNESTAHAMQREFKEEAGIDINGWEHYVTLEVADATIYFFKYSSTMLLDNIRSMEEEEVLSANVLELPDLNTIYNLQWLIPLAYDPSVIFPLRIEDTTRFNRT